MDMPWPEPGVRRPLKNIFWEVPSEFLADAARAFYFWGYWSPHNQSAMGAGASRKFADYADQVLREKLSLPRSFRGRGIGYQVHEGYLRVCYSDEKNWRWNEFGRATLSTFERAQAVVTLTGKDGNLEDWWKRLEHALVYNLAPNTKFGEMLREKVRRDG